jgi:hypothetical protein
MLCLLLLSGCFSDDVIVRGYALTWTCLSPDGCERTAEVAQIDWMERVRFDCEFTSTQDESFVANAKEVDTEFLPPGCNWLYFLTLFGHELERSRFCFVPGGFELELSIPDEDPATSSMWLVEGRDVKLL